MSHEPGERWDTLDTFTEPDHYSAQTRVVVERAASPVLCGDWLASGRASCELIYGHGGDLHRAGSLSWRMAQRDAAPLPTQLAQPTGRRAELIYELLSFANRAPVEQVEALTARTRGPSPIALVYIAGPYTAPDAWGVEQNVRRAEVVGYEIAKLGAMPVCPHTNLRFMCSEIAAFMYPATLELMRRCDSVFLLPDWQSSTGARDEREDALRVGIPRFSTIRSLAEWLSARGKRDGGA